MRAWLVLWTVLGAVLAGTPDLMCVVGEGGFYTCGVLYDQMVCRADDAACQAERDMPGTFLTTPDPPPPLMLLQQPLMLHLGLLIDVSARIPVGSIPDVHQPVAAYTSKHIDASQAAQLRLDVHGDIFRHSHATPHVRVFLLADTGRIVGGTAVRLDDEDDVQCWRHERHAGKRTGRPADAAVSGTTEVVVQHCVWRPVFRLQDKRIRVRAEVFYNPAYVEDDLFTVGLVVEGTLVPP